MISDPIDLLILYALVVLISADVTFNSYKQFCLLKLLFALLLSGLGFAVFCTHILLSFVNFKSISLVPLPHLL